MNNRIIAGCLLIVVGCGADSASDEWNGSVRDSSGVLVIENPETGFWTPTTAWRLEEDLRIGVAEGDLVRQFADIEDIAVDTAGRIYVLDRQASEVRVFDAEGAFLRTIGRQGRGPGELASPAAVLIGRGDTLLVPDTRNQRIQRFLTDGSDAGSFPISPSEGISLGWGSRPDGLLLQELRTFPAAEAEERIVVVARRSDGEVVDTVLEVPVGDAMVIRNGQPHMTMFAPEPFWATLTDGSIVSGRNSEYRLEVRTPDGVVERIVRRPHERLSFSEADRREFRARLSERLQDRPPSPATDRMLKAMGYADYYPVFAALFGGPDGTIWVEHAKTISTVDSSDMEAFDVRAFGASTYDVFDAEGRFLGVLAAPDRFEPMRAYGGHVYGVERDELGVQRVVRLRLQRRVVSL